MFPVLYLPVPNEPVYFLSFVTSRIRIRTFLSMRIRIQEAYLYADPDPKRCLAYSIFWSGQSSFMLICVTQSKHLKHI